MCANEGVGLALSCLHMRRSELRPRGTVRVEILYIVGETHQARTCQVNPVESSQYEANPNQATGKWNVVCLLCL